MISLGEVSGSAKAHVGLDVRSPEPPTMPGSMAWVAEALKAEREAIVQEMTERHNALLRELQVASTAGPQEPQKSLLSAPPHETTSGILQMDSLFVGPNEAQQKLSPRCEATRKEESLPNRKSDRIQKLSLETNDPLFLTSSSWEREGIDSAEGLRYVFIRLRMAVYSSRCEVAIALVIVMNSMVMAVKAQYLSLDTAHALRLPDAAPADVEWPGAEETLFMLDFCFGAIFTLEVLFKFSLAPGRFVKSMWNWFDTSVVLLWVLFLYGLSNVNPMLLRLLRLARLSRLLRLVKTVQIFDVLHLLVGSLRASLSVMMWSLLFLSGIMVVGALTFNIILEPYIVDESKPYDLRKNVYIYYGSFTRAFVTMFESTLGNWIVPLRLLHENVSELSGPVFLLWLCVVNFAVVQVIRSTFMCETFKVASSDDEIMVMQKLRQMNKHRAAIQRFFEKADESGDGYLSLSEFKQVTSDPTMRVWLSAMELDVYDAALVFQMMGNRDGQLSAQELIQGVSRLKGAARSIDLIAVQAMCRRIEKHVMALDEALASGVNRTPRSQQNNAIQH